MVIERIGEVVIPGLLIVFIALVILIYSVEIMGKVLSALQSRASQPKETAGNAVKSDDAHVAVSGGSSASSGIPEETVAVISAAVACAMETAAPGVPYAVRRIERAREERPIWGFAGMQRNTRPF